MYTVEELHQGYNDWYELIWVGTDHHTFANAVEAAKGSHRWQLKITRWDQTQRQEEWYVKDGELQRYCEGCYTHHDENDFAHPRATYCTEYIERKQQQKDDY